MTTLDTVKQRLRQRYLDSLPDKVAVLEQALEGLDNGSSCDGAATSIRRLAHQLSGSAASYGFPQAGALAKQVELADDSALATQTHELCSRLTTIVSEQSAPCISVLIVDDDPDIARLAQALLASPSRSIRWAQTLAEARAYFHQMVFDLVILDLVLPDEDGRNLLAELRNRAETRDTPVIVLSGIGEALVKNECAIYGVDQYIEKPLNEETFARQVGTALTRSRTFMREALEDPLTGLNNRAGFRKQYEQALATCRRNSQPLSLAILDIDHFKQFNDTYGHEVGDLALVTTSNVLSNILRRSDIRGRWGGEEFVVALPDTTIEPAQLALAKVRAELRATEISDSCDRRLAFSGGLVEVGEHEDLDLALLRADQLLYCAKKGGRDQVLHTVTSVQSDKPTILVAEDDAQLAGLLLEALRDDYRVVHVPDGTSAVKKAQRKPPFDLVLLDYHMPGFTGIEVLRQLRNSSDYEKRPILLLTAVGSDEVIEEAFEAGADDYVAKPVGPRALLSRLRRHLSRGAR